jgi:DNA-binding SARP family transcriptional activator
MNTVHPSAGQFVHLLGYFAVTMDGQLLTLRPSAQRVLALLGVRGATARSDAAGLLWPDLSQFRARDNLRTVLWRLRRDADALVAEEGGVLRLAGTRIDYLENREWAWHAIRGDDPDVPPPDGVTAELLPGWSDEWLIEVREEFRILTLYALEGCAQRLLERTRIGEAVAVARSAVSVDPLRESANRILIEAQLRAGNELDALRQYRRYADLLERELQAEPSPRLMTLVTSANASPPPGRGGVVLRRSRRN